MSDKDFKADVKDEVKTEVKGASAKSNTQKFIERKLKVINEISDKAKAKRLAERVLRNK